MRPKVYVLVGLPGSGKSTWKKNNVAELDLVSTDAYIEEIAEAQGLSYEQSFNQFIKEAEKNLEATLSRLVLDRRSFVWDQTNLSRKKRSLILSKIPKDYEKIVVEFFCDRSEILKRIDSRCAESTIKKCIPKNLLDRMQEQYQPVDLNVEKFDLHIKVTT